MVVPPLPLRQRPSCRKVGRHRTGQIYSGPLVAAFFLFLETSWDLPRHHVFLSSILLGKTWKNRGFWHPQTLPKLPPKPFKIDVQKTNRFFLFFERCSFKFETFETLKISISLRKITIFQFFAEVAFNNLANFRLQKIIEKTFKNHIQTMKKSSLKSTCF